MTFAEFVHHSAPRGRRMARAGKGEVGDAFFFTRDAHLMAESSLQPVSGESSDDCARGGDTSSSRSLRPCPRSSTIQPCGDRRRPVSGRWRSKLRTSAYGHRRLLHRVSGRASLRSPGRRITRCTSRRRSGRILLPRRQALSTFLWTSKMCLPPAPGQTVCLTCLVRRSGFCGALWSNLLTVPVVPVLVKTFVTVPFLDVLVP